LNANDGAPMLTPSANELAIVVGRGFIKDYCRLEELCTHVENWEGRAIMLTNDASLWKTPSTNVDTDFRVKEGRIVRGAIVGSDATALRTT
jgi:hypothetical protein